MHLFCALGIHKYAIIRQASRATVREEVIKKCGEWYVARAAAVAKTDSPPDTKPTRGNCLATKVCTRCGFVVDDIGWYALRLKLRYNEIARLRDENGLDGDPSEIARLID